jgi:hypothetical protein
MKLTRGVFLVVLAATVAAQEAVDLNIVHRIKAEAFKKSKVMDHLAALTDRYGPRLTASPEYDASANWAMEQMREWGLESAHLEKWGPWGRSWSIKRFSINLLEPQFSNLAGFPLAWSDATRGIITAEPFLLPIRGTDMEKLKAEIERVRREYVGKLQGKLVMTTAVRSLPMQIQPPAKRYTDGELAAQAMSPELMPPRQFDYSKLALPEEEEERRDFLRNAPRGFAEALRDRGNELRRELHDFLRSEGAVGILVTDRRGDGGTVFGEAAGWWQAKYAPPLPTIALTPEHYNRIARLVRKNVPVKIEFEIRAETSQTDVEAANVVAEIRGAAKPDEVVMVGAHLDSWHGGTGATDNAAGCAVALEVMRILKTLNLKLDRTVRIALWSGEEQGLFGSREYVKAHFGDLDTMKVAPEHDRLSAYFNLDNGGGKIRGVYLQENDAARPVFERWFAPFRDLGVNTIAIRNTGGTDHLSFDALGLPGFQFIQDPLEYGSRTHHSNMDVYDRIQAGDLMQASAVMAAVIYHAANRPEKMPRKPLPEPQPKWTPTSQNAVLPSK